MAAGKVCANCGLINHPERRTCKQCRADLDAPIVRASDTPLEIATRKDLLDQEIRKHVVQGWAVVNRTETTAQLTMEHQVNGCLVLMLLAFGIVPGLIYLVMHKSRENLYLEVDEYGSVQRMAQA